MILVDTSVWVDHLRRRDEALAELLEAGIVLMHPFIIGELALGGLKRRKFVFDALSDLPRVTIATDNEVLQFIERNELFRRGVGYVDAPILAGVRLTAGAELWTRDKRLHAAALELEMAFTLH